MNAHTAGRRAGFSLVETLVALIVFGTVFAATISTLHAQLKAFTNGQRQLDAAQYVRFTLSTLEKDLPSMGSGVPDGQPFVVYADTSVLSYNSDFVSNVANDLYAVYVDSTTTSAATMSVPHSRRFTIPLSTFQYPDTTYRNGGALSPAETITFYFVLDTATARVDDFMLWRKVNDQAPELVARDVLHTPNRPFFLYHRVTTPASGPVYLDSIPPGWLPLRHSAAIHLGTDDTLPASRIDAIRAVEINFQITDARPGGDERIYVVRRRITLPNAGKTARKTCGDSPLLGNIGFTVVPFIDPITADTLLRVRWNASVDETAGEQDVMRYVIWRDTVAITVAADPFLNIPAGAPPYEFDDTNVVSGTRYYYALAAQDCTPSLSSLATAWAIVP